MRVKRRVKVCSMCKEIRPTIEFGHLEKSPDGLKDKCKKCRVKVRRSKMRVAKRNSISVKTRVCPECKVRKPRHLFYVNVLRKSGMSCHCKSCTKRRAREWRVAHPDYFKRSLRRLELERSYGMTEEEYAHLLKMQNFRCAICKTDVPGGRYGKFHLDHNHDTGELRGLLCGRCNAALGMFCDSLKSVMRAAKYLRNGGVSKKYGFEYVRVSSSKTARCKPAVSKVCERLGDKRKGE